MTQFEPIKGVVNAEVVSPLAGQEDKKFPKQGKAAKLLLKRRKLQAHRRMEAHCANLSGW